MEAITRRIFMAAAASVALAGTVRAEKPAALTGYSPGNQLSKIDGLELLNLWRDQPESIQQLYVLIDSVLSRDPTSTYADVGRDEDVQQFCRQHNVLHLGGPMLGCITETSAKVWVRTVRPSKVEVRMTVDGSEISYGPVPSTEDSDLVAIG